MARHALDVDDIVTARIAVEDARQLLGLALEAAGAGTWDWDMQTGVVSLDPATRGCMARLSGERAAPPERRDLDGPAQPDDAADAWNEVRRSIDSRSTYAAQFRVGDRWIYGRGRTVFGADDRPVRMVGLHLDITDSKATEAALRAANHDAEMARAESRAGERGQEQLPGGHEPRDPHAAQQHHRLCRPAARRRYDPGEDRRRLSLIQNSGAALLTVVNDVLDFSKVNAGELTLESLSFPLVGMIDAAISIVRGSALKSGLAIKSISILHCPGSLWAIRAAEAGAAQPPE